MEAKDIVTGMPVSKDVAIILQQKARINEVFNHMEEVLDTVYITEEEKEEYIITVSKHLEEVTNMLNSLLLDAIEEQLASRQNVA